MRYAPDKNLEKVRIDRAWQTHYNKSNSSCKRLQSKGRGCPTKIKTSLAGFEKMCYLMAISRMYPRKADDRFRKEGFYETDHPSKRRIPCAPPLRAVPVCGTAGADDSVQLGHAVGVPGLRHRIGRHDRLLRCKPDDRNGRKHTGQCVLLGRDKRPGGTDASVQGYLRFADGSNTDAENCTDV